MKGKNAGKKYGCQIGSEKSSGDKRSFSAIELSDWYIFLAEKAGVGAHYSESNDRLKVSVDGAEKNIESSEDIRKVFLSSLKPNSLGELYDGRLPLFVVCLPHFPATIPL